MKTEDQMYREAFNGPSEAAMDDVTGTADKMTPDDSAASEASETPTVAVVITGEEGDEAGADIGEPTDEQMTPEEIQQEKTWAGRLKKREAELKAREAALAERESGVVQAKCGGKVAMKADGGMIEEEPMDGEEMAMEEAPMPEEDGMEAEPVGMDEPEPEAEMETEKMSDDAIIEEGLSTYGPEFEGFIAALIRRYVAAEADPIVGMLSEKIAQVQEGLSSGLENMHMNVLDALIDGVEEIAESAEFQSWIEAMPDEDKAKAQSVIESGTVRQIKGLIDQFAQSQKAGSERSPEDIWAEDAATAVKGKSPVRLPDRPAMSPDDEYSKAFNSL